MATITLTVLSSPWTPLPLHTSGAAWNTKRSSTLTFDLPKATFYTLDAPKLAPPPPQKPRLKLLSLTAAPPSSTSHEQQQQQPQRLPARRFDPFCEDANAQNKPAAAPAVVAEPVSLPAAPVVRGRRRSPSFSAGSGCTRASLASMSLQLPSIPSSSCSAPPRHTKPALAPQPGSPCPGAPTPYMARHYSSSDSRSRLLARTLLNRINAVGRPRSVCGSRAAPLGNGYEDECGGRPYIPTRLSECVTA
ncbi:unnamed protein product [Mycena citricolor]|uniref:Uncharacterized protein n=1 Tax=Mycena citricolor TaxID=2018698 RepID=A0AAD2JW50_9AGAR|nr:unnamed protein product [Mycena citricolor]